MGFRLAHARFQGPGGQLGRTDAGECAPGGRRPVPEGESGLVKGLLEDALEQPVGDQAAGEVRRRAGEPGGAGAAPQLDFGVGGGQRFRHRKGGPASGLLRGRRRVGVHLSLIHI